MRMRFYVGLLAALFPIAALAADLAELYPARLTAGDTAPERARKVTFSRSDLFQISKFNFKVGEKLSIEVGKSDLGLGRTADGAVWALILPRESGSLVSSEGVEEIAHVWLRFHPAQVNKLFPPETVSTNANQDLFTEMRVIAAAKFLSSWHAGDLATIADPNIYSVDIDTKGGVRRFYSVDTKAESVRYYDAFKDRAVRKPPAITPELAAETFDRIWKAFDESYAMFVLRPEVDWSAAREEFRPKAIQSKNVYDFAGICAEMLKRLRDLHVWLTVAGADLPLFNRPRESNFNVAALPSMVGPLQSAGRSVRWAITPEQIGYVFIPNWSDPEIPDRFDEVLEKMRETRALIIDVRPNGGGSEPLAQKVAGRFAQNDFKYAFSKVRNGPRHNDMSEFRARAVSPRGPWLYTRPVALLIGERCMSSNESFAAMMTGATNVTSIGGHTCGSSGNPEIIKLPLEMTVSVPRWIDYLPDQTPLDERGVQPQIHYSAGEGDFEGARDGLLGFTLERLRKVPTPKEPMTTSDWLPPEARLPRGLRKTVGDITDYGAIVNKESADKSRPAVVSVFPADGAEQVDLEKPIRIRFDRPMNPRSLKIEWNAGGFLKAEFPEYDARTFEFTIPVRLAPGALHQIVLNNAYFGGNPIGSRPRDGFQGEDQTLAHFFAWRFTTTGTRAGDSTNRAHLLTASPATNSSTPLLSFVELQFDRPMMPPGQAFPYLLHDNFDGMGPTLLASVNYNPDRHSFKVPILLRASGRSTVNIAGLRDSEGVVAAPIRFNFQVSTNDVSSISGPEDQRLLDLLGRMKSRRAEITSISERVQTVFTYQEDGLFTRLASASARLDWQPGGKYFADVSEMTHSRAFQIGSDGTNWWWRYQSEKTNFVERCPAGEMTLREISFCDPFGLTTNSPAQSAQSLRLKYHGIEQRGDAKVHLIDRWQAERMNDFAFGSRTVWMIDSQTLLPAECVTYGDSFVQRIRFDYEAINKQLSDERFSASGEVPLRPMEPLGANFTGRFVKVSDGANGTVRVRWGKVGNGNMSGSGLD